MNIEVNGIKITLTSEQLQEIERQKSNTPEKLFKELIKGIDINKSVVDFEKYSNSIFWFKGDKLVFEYNFKNHDFWINYDEIWSKFYPFFNDNYYDVQTFMKVQVEEHFKLKGVTPLQILYGWFCQVEEHFKLKGVTPEGSFPLIINRVEEHFKLKGVTPHGCTWNGGCW